MLANFRPWPGLCCHVATQQSSTDSVSSEMRHSYSGRSAKQKRSLF